MASITLKRGTKAEIEATQVQDGQLLMETDQLNNNKIYIDLPNGTRVPVGGSGAWVGTQAEYEEAVEEGKIADGTQVLITDDYEFGNLTANMVLYSNAQSSLTSTNVQAALDEVSRGGKELTKVEYDRLSEEKKMNGTSYFITDYNALSPQMVDLPKATYDALPAEKKTDGTTYFVYDENANITAENIPYGNTTVGDELTTLNSTMKWEVDHYSDVASIASYAQQINEADKVRCIKLKNGARIITGCVIINGQINSEPIFTVPQEFARNGYPMQAWVCGVSSNRYAYMFLFNGNVLYPWGNLPSVGDYISFYIVY